MERESSNLESQKYNEIYIEKSKVQESWNLQAMNHESKDKQDLRKWEIEMTMEVRIQERQWIN